MDWTDYHTHCRWSMDGRYSMADMARAAVKRGLREICFTDHVEVYGSGKQEPNTFDFTALDREYDEARAAVDGQIIIRRGIELGEAPRDFARAEALLAQLSGKLDFVIGSIHQLGADYGWRDLAYTSVADPAESRRQIREYLELVLAQARWGRFCVQGHLTLPLRYINELRGGQMNFDGFEAEVEEIFHTLISKGCGIEVNANHGHTPLPDAKWLRLYRQCGGEIITTGSDAHSLEEVGCNIPQLQELLRACGFRAFCTYEAMKPVFHDL